ncbi:MAG: CBS domain-containing protein [Bdellovibrionales bacterium]|nr:CBS domain-containing protein [Bdellovibrionales bacterium]
MFYISDVTGIQTPYTQELLRAQREQEAFEASALIAEVPEAAGSREPSGKPVLGVRSSSINPAIGGAASSLRSSDDADQSRGVYEGAPRAGREVVREVSAIEPKIEERKKPASGGSSQKFVRHENPYAKLDEPQPERKPAVTAQQIMSSPVVTVQADRPLTAAKKIFQSQRFRHLPVVSSEGRLVGILSDRDALSAPMSAGRISEVMTKGVLTARPEAEIREMAKIMIEERIGAMPIVDETHQLVGILTRTDILRTVMHHAPLELWL